MHSRMHCCSAAYTAMHQFGVQWKSQAYAARRFNCGRDKPYSIQHMSRRCSCAKSAPAGSSARTGREQPLYRYANATCDRLVMALRLAQNQ